NLAIVCGQVVAALASSAVFAQRTREPRELVPGDSTAYAGAVDYRIKKLAAHVAIRGDWLDCGSAEGFYAVALREAGADKVVGCDIIPERIAWARQHWASVAGVSTLSAPASRSA